MEYVEYEIGGKIVKKEEIDKAVKKIINSLEESQKNYGIAKFILERSIEKLDEVCIVKNL
ncbi:MAG: hypothetical protein HFJ41_03965 [Clostridia bacterium]|nr:hypothetical protein [Clostridia bacterium]